MIRDGEMWRERGKASVCMYVLCGKREERKKTWALFIFIRSSVIRLSGRACLPYQIHASFGAHRCSLSFYSLFARETRRLLICCAATPLYGTCSPLLTPLDPPVPGSQAKQNFLAIAPAHGKWIILFQCSSRASNLQTPQIWIRLTTWDTRLSGAMFLFNPGKGRAVFPKEKNRSPSLQAALRTGGRMANRSSFASITSHCEHCSESAVVRQRRSLTEAIHAVHMVICPANCQWCDRSATLSSRTMTTSSGQCEWVQTLERIDWQDR